jgi:succinate-semialdehyde dehydrogenase/glutarate-semialdehyde dehydrogenase
MQGRYMQFKRKWQTADEQVSVIDPATEEVVNSVTLSTVDDVDKAIDTAWETFETWSETDPGKRGEILYNCADRIEDAKDELAELLTKEQGKPLRESRLELDQFIRTLRYNAGLARNIQGKHIQLDHGEDGVVIKEPYGVCGAILPWNFPISLFGNKIGPGLIAGNTFVAKPALTTPLTTIRTVEIMEEAGLPEDAITILIGEGSTIGKAISTHNNIRKIAFTGSTEVGKEVMRNSAETIKPVTLELGGSDPMIVCEEADLDDAISAAAVGRFFNNGQACLAIKRLFVQETIADDFIEGLIDKVEKLSLGSGLDNPMLGPLHQKWLCDEMDDFITDAVKRGATVLTGGSRSEDHDTGYFYEPTLLTNVDPDADISQQECFGPVLPVYRFSDWKRVIDRANDTKYGLGSSVWTQDISKAKTIASRLEAGYTWINARQIERNELPFGGLKQSGIGKEHGTEGLEAYLQTRSIVIGG